MTWDAHLFRDACSALNTGVRAFVAPLFLQPRNKASRAHPGRGWSCGYTASAVRRQLYLAFDLDETLHVSGAHGGLAPVRLRAPLGAGSHSTCCARRGAQQPATCSSARAMHLQSASFKAKLLGAFDSTNQARCAEPACVLNACLQLRLFCSTVTPSCLPRPQGGRGAAVAQGAGGLGAAGGA